MFNFKYEKWIILSLGLYFGWLLAFPLYGPVFHLSLTVHQQADNFYLPLLFVFWHALSFILGGIFLRNIYMWKKLMIVGLFTTIIVNVLFLFFSYKFWFVGMSILGISSAIYILGWSSIYTMYIPTANRMKKMALIIIISNGIFVLINWFSTYLSLFYLLLIVILPLIISIIALKNIPASLQLEAVSQSRNNKDNNEKLLSLNKLLILIFCVFVAGLYLNSGFMYNIMFPLFEEGLPSFNSYKFFPYIAVLFLMYKFSDRVQHYLPVYLGVTLLGMSFVAFALISENIVGLLISLTLIEASFAFLDLFVWVSMGNLAFIYGSPYQFFGFVLGAKVFSILAGDLIGSEITQVGETYQLVTAIFTAGTIFLTYLLIPWLNHKMNIETTEMVAATVEEAKNEDEELFVALSGQLQPGEYLTPREKEVARLILKGFKNKEIAEELFISENTLKSHLRNIYPKFGVSQKRELLSIALNLKKSLE